jgi:hypothetical protein
MVGEDCQVRIKKLIKQDLENLEFVRKKHSYSQIVNLLICFYKDNKGGFEKWQKNKNKIMK